MCEGGEWVEGRAGAAAEGAEGEAEGEGRGREYDGRVDHGVGLVPGRYRKSVGGSGGQGDIEAARCAYGGYAWLVSATAL